MFKLTMEINRISKNSNNIETQNDASVIKKNNNQKNTKTGRVDINVLKSKLEAEQGKEFRKNLLIFSFCALLLSLIGIFLSL